MISEADPKRFAGNGLCGELSYRKDYTSIIFRNA
jgi:hypothetical protein